MNDPVGPVGVLTAEQVHTALVAATAAPSPHNSRPWRFRCSPHEIELYADHRRALPVTDPDHRELTMACGAALLNLRLAIKAMGVFPDVRVSHDHDRSGLLATVRPTGRRVATAVDRALAAAIPRRHTNHRPFVATAVATSIRHELRLAAEVERAWLAILEPTQLPLLRVLTRRADETQLVDAERTGHAERVPTRDVGSPDGRVRDLGGSGALEWLPDKDFEADPLIAVVGSFQDGPAVWLQAGQAVQRVLLTATAGGLAAAFLPQVVEVPATRLDLRTLVGGAVWPQAVLRIGHESRASGTDIDGVRREPARPIVAGCRLKP